MVSKKNYGRLLVLLFPWALLSTDAATSTAELTTFQGTASLNEAWTRTHASESDNPVIKCKKCHAVCYFEAVLIVSAGSVFVVVAADAACK